MLSRCVGSWLQPRPELQWLLVANRISFHIHLPVSTCRYAVCTSLGQRKCVDLIDGMAACRWYEPAWKLLGKHNSLSAYGSVYALSQRTISNVIVPNIEKLRFLANEGVTTHAHSAFLCMPCCCTNGAMQLLRSKVNLSVELHGYSRLLSPLEQVVRHVPAVIVVALSVKISAQVDICALLSTFAFVHQLVSCGEYKRTSKA